MDLRQEHVTTENGVGEYFGTGSAITKNNSMVRSRLSLGGGNYIESMDTPLANPEEEEEEYKSLARIIAAFRHYRKYSYTHVTKAQKYLNSLPHHHQKMLSKYREHLSTIGDCIDANQAVIKRILGKSTPYGDIKNTFKETDMQPINIDQIEKAQSTLKLIARDWSAVCSKEREQSYKPIIDAIEEYFKPGNFAIDEIKILIPGSGLGRLMYELACRGYECEGNEFSYFMLIASHFVLNKCTAPNEFTLYPWIHQYVNNLRRSDQIAAVRFPDVCPTIDRPKGNMRVASGDFLEVYKDPNAWHCVATSFFLDCAHNVIDFIETIYRILVPGGIWVNLGPLLYHFCDIENENSIEPTFEDIVPIIETVGFELLRKQTGIRTKYAQNPESMLKCEYESLFWVCRKPLTAADGSDDAEVQANGSSSLVNLRHYKLGGNQ